MRGDAAGLCADCHGMKTLLQTGLSRVVSAASACAISFVFVSLVLYDNVLLYVGCWLFYARRGAQRSGRASF